MGWPAGRKHDSETIRKMSETHKAKNARQNALIAEALAARAEKARHEAAQKLADLQADLARAEQEAERAAKLVRDAE